ncbi:MAG TPA: hypothetical protein VHD87_18230 [Acidimicrobiales bacterium]|nr:hypothetical protein [Acidimicrobiales bacterium]
MRKLALVFLASAALLGSGACNGKKDDNASANVNANAKANTNAASHLSGAAAAAAASKVCDSSAAIAFAATAATAAANSAGTDFKSMSQVLKTDAAAAPSEIKADFQLVADTEGAYLDLFASANGNYMTVAQNPQFQSLAQKMSSADFKAAVQHIDSYFQQHCGAGK